MALRPEAVLLAYGKAHGAPRTEMPFQVSTAPLVLFRNTKIRPISSEPDGRSIQPAKNFHASEPRSGPGHAACLVNMEFDTPVIRTVPQARGL